jgi:hypothetical protein
MPADNHPVKDYVCAGQHEQTQLWRGLLYRNHPTPSGWDRMILALSTTLGFATEAEAVQAMISGLKPEYVATIDIPNIDRGSTS